MKLKFLNNKKLEILAHIAIWIGYSFIVFSGPIMTQDFSEDTLLLTIRALAVNSILFYVNTFVLLPRLVGRGKYFGYIITIVTILLGTSALYQLTDPLVKPAHFNKPMEMVIDSPNNYHSRTFTDDDIYKPKSSPKDFKWGKRPGMFFGFMSSLGILFISTIFWVITETKRREKRELSLINENLSTEMKFLKSQINPHFLFNALNNVYSLSHTNSAKTPEMILKLSDMLRFVLYESEDKKVQIGKEINYIDHFISFQKLKIEGEPRIFVNFENIDRTIMIEPMLLIPFIENAFKHSKIEDLRNGWMRIELLSNKNEIRFSVANSLPASSFQVDGIGGIGIENVKKRLNYLYPNKHELYISQKEKEFLISLNIQLTSKPS